jgi:hypothetical protein
MVIPRFKTSGNPVSGLLQRSVGILASLVLFGSQVSAAPALEINASSAGAHLDSDLWKGEEPTTLCRCSAFWIQQPQVVQ